MLNPCKGLNRFWTACQNTKHPDVTHERKRQQTWHCTLTLPQVWQGILSQKSFLSASFLTTASKQECWLFLTFNTFLYKHSAASGVRLWWHYQNNWEIGFFFFCHRTPLVFSYCLCTEQGIKVYQDYHVCCFQMNIKSTWGKRGGRMGSSVSRFTPLIPLLQPLTSSPSFGGAVPNQQIPWWAVQITKTKGASLLHKLSACCANQAVRQMGQVRIWAGENKKEKLYLFIMKSCSAWPFSTFGGMIPSSSLKSIALCADHGWSWPRALSNPCFYLFLSPHVPQYPTTQQIVRTH